MVEKKDDEEIVSEEDVKRILSSITETDVHKESVCDSIITRLNSIRDKLKLPDWVCNKLTDFDKFVEVDVPLVLDKKHHDRQVVRLLPAFRVQHNNVLGPYKGGIRFHVAVNLEEMKGLAAIMTIKNALLNLPFGGAKGGVAVNPKELSKQELERLARAYVKKFARFLGARKDIPAPDVGTDSRIMDIMSDEFKKITNGVDAEASFTGKSLSHHGLKEREIATALGGFYILQEFLKQKEAGEIPGAEYKDLLKTKKQELKVAIQGFGNVGKNIAKILYAEGFKIIAVSDSKGGIASVKGLDPAEIEKWKYRQGTVAGLSKTIKISNKQLLAMKTDILVSAALENQITEKNVYDIKAPIILELANGAINCVADRILYEQGKTVLPDVLVNAGGVVVSYFEWLQNIENRSFKKGEVEDMLKEKMISALDNVMETSKQYNTSLRDAAYILAVKKIAQAMLPKKK